MLERLSRRSKFVKCFNVISMEYKNIVRKIPVCLECGDKIKYGRTDKKFCCEECRNKHHNREASEARAFKRKILRLLDRNYEILESLLRSGSTGASMPELLSRGFSPQIVTSFSRTRKRCECCCFDIKYRLTPGRISFISKIQNVSVTLQDGMEMNDQQI